MSQSQSPRRRNLLKGAAVAAGVMSAPMVAKTQTGPISMRWQSAGRPRISSTSTPWTTPRM